MRKWGKPVNRISWNTCSLRERIDSRKDEIDLLTLKNGGGNNAFTSHDFTAYYFNFASDRWNIALDIEADRMVNCTFDTDEFEAEKKVVIEELKTSLDSPWGLLHQELDATAYKVHPYRNPIVGWLQDVERATAANSRRTIESIITRTMPFWFLSETLIPIAVLKTSRSSFRAIPAGPARAADDLVGAGAARRETHRRPMAVQVPRLAIAYHAPEIAHPDSYAFRCWV